MVLSFIKTTCDSIKNAIKSHQDKQESMRRRYEVSTSTKNALYTLAMTATTEEQLALVDSLKSSFLDSENELQDITNEFQVSEEALVAQRGEVRECITDLFKIYDSMSTALKKDVDAPVKDIMLNLQDTSVTTQIRTEPSVFDTTFRETNVPSAFDRASSTHMTVGEDDFVPEPFGSGD